MGALHVPRVKAEQSELLGPLDVLTEFPSERIQQMLGHLFIDKGHPAPNFWNNYRKLTAAYSAPASVTDEALQSFDQRGHKHVADAIRRVVPPVPDHVTINESMDRALQLAVLQPTPHINDVIQLLAAAHQPLGALWTEYATSHADQDAVAFMEWAREELPDRPVDSRLIQAIAQAGSPRSTFHIKST